MIKLNSNDIIGQNAIVIADSPLELIFSIQLKMTLLSNVDTTIIISNQSSNAKEHAKNLKSIKIFDEVIYSETKGFPFKKSTRIKRMGFSYARLCINEARKYVENMHFDIMFSSEIDCFSRSIYIALKEKNPQMKSYIIGEGLFGYAGLEANIKRVKYTQIFLNKYLKEYDGVVLINPDMCIDKHERIVEMPGFSNKNKKLIEVLNKTFDYEPHKQIFRKKIIFYEESYVNDGGDGKDVELVSEITKHFGKQNVMIKRHPRGDKNRFESLDVYTYEKYWIPWEVILLNGDCQDCLDIAFLSGAVILPYVYGFSDNSCKVLTYKMKTYDSRFLRSKAGKKYVYFAEQLVKHDKNIFTPDSYEALEWVIKSITGK